MKERHFNRIVGTYVNLSVLIFSLSAISIAAEEVCLPGPNGLIKAFVSTDAQGQLVYRLTHKGNTVIETSALGVTVDGQTLGKKVKIKPPARREISTSYAWRGVKNRAVNNCNSYDVPVIHQASGLTWILELRVFDDGMAYRYRIGGTGRRKIEGEATSWQLPKGTSVWYQTNTANYEGVYNKSSPEDIPLETKGGQGERPVFLGYPVTAELPNGKYALLSEAGLYNYSGMTLKPTGTRTFEAVFEDDPKGFVVDGPIISPWRITIVTENLNDLVNSDLIHNVCEPPDSELFPDGINTGWIRPGKGLITWAVFGNDGARWDRQKWFVEMCAKLNCEYLLVDGGWRSERWGWLKDGGDLWSRLDELCRYAAKRNVDIFVWHAYPEGRNDGPGLTDRAKREEFFKRCKAAGVKGVKVDFFDSERKEIVDVYEDILSMTAKYQLMVNFHGANKPAGEVRTWPHEITREGIREQEYLLWGQLPLHHYAALPFTRLVAGHGDFLPTYIRPKYLKNTTAVFQLATSIIFHSPFICWPDHPEAYLESSFLPLIRTMPAVWDETRVLEGSEIGAFISFARRSGEDWYVAVLNCREKEKTYSIPLAFLGEGDYQAALYHDAPGPRASVRIETGHSVQKGQTISIRLKGGGGFVGRFSKPKEYTK
ncbi:MAG: glycoside hydrolase family 97 protein [Planctomycetota bacterium]|jgi:hypothetical protein